MARSAQQAKTRKSSPLRQAQRELTRTRIRDAAKQVFYEHHFSLSTIESIASAAGVSRATLYLHYRDKEEILGEIINEYIPRAKEVLSRMPGPNPSIPQLEKWIRSVAAFVETELMPLSIFEDVRHVFPDGVDKLVRELTAAMGEHNPVLREAAQKTACPMLRAKALLLLTELTYTSRWYCESDEKKFAEALVTTTAQDFAQFLTREKR